MALAFFALLALFVTKGHCDEIGAKSPGNALVELQMDEIAANYDDSFYNEAYYLYGGYYQNDNSEDILQLHKLTFDSAPTCNDGSSAGYYLRQNTESTKWVIYLQGGWYCYDEASCKMRYDFNRDLMSSEAWGNTKSGNGIYSPRREENPYLYESNLVYIPYCSSDVWTGSARNKKLGKVTLSFMGHDILTEIFKSLINNFGMMNSSVVVLSGSSAGANGALLNSDRLQKLLTSMGSSGKIRTIVDSGWFVQRPDMEDDNLCSSPLLCSPIASLKRGIALWEPILPSDCLMGNKVPLSRRINQMALTRQDKWKCYFSKNIYPHVKVPVYIVQWMFDEAQLFSDNINLLDVTSFAKRRRILQYVKTLAEELKGSFKNVNAVFAPSCVSHAILEKSDWRHTRLSGTNLVDAINCWEKHLDYEEAEATMSRDNGSRRLVSKHVSAEFRHNRVNRVFVSRQSDESGNIVLNADEYYYQETERHHKTNSYKSAPTCLYKFIDNCPFPQCNPTCPSVYFPATGRQLAGTDLMQLLGFDINQIAAEIGFDEPLQLLQLLSDG